MLNRRTNELEIESAHATPKRAAQSEEHRIYTFEEKQSMTIEECIRIAKSLHPTPKFLTKEEHDTLMEEWKNSGREIHVIRHGDFSSFPNFE